MQHGQMIRYYVKGFFAFAMLGMVAACADNNTAAPVSQEAAVYVPANFLKVGNGTVFRVNNSQGIVQKVGAHVLYIPAGAICDPLTSGYGPTKWNDDCKPLRGSIVITATVFNGKDGQPYVDFQPAMRFAPDQEVMLFFREGRSNGAFKPSIEYCNNLGYCVDESIEDASLRPFRIGSTSILARRVKHFSGYMVAYNEVCMGSSEPTGDGGFYCNEGGMGAGASMARRSGYMVASGEDIADIMKDDAAEKGNSHRKH